jgi:hypothetical protein
VLWFVYKVCLLDNFDRNGLPTAYQARFWVNGGTHMYLIGRTALAYLGEMCALVF